MSNRPKIMGSRNIRNPNKFTKIKTPVRLRFHHHVGDMSGCGTIRVIQPSLILNNYYSPDVQFEAIFDNRFQPYPNAYQQCSIVTFQRSASKQQLDMIKYFKKMNPGKRIIYEIDDDLLNIPDWNFASGFYNENRVHIEAILRMVDGIIVSTPELKRLLSEYNNNINISVNHLPKFIWGEPEVAQRYEGKARIMYAGSHNHFDPKGDKGDFSPELIDFVSKTSDVYEWVFVGGIPQTLKNDGNIKHYPWKPVIEYPSFLKQLQPDICLAPLEDNKFNRSKSNIKALESVALGVPLLASNLEPYRGIPHTCSTTEQMISGIETLASDSYLRTIYWSDQYNALKSQLFWEDNEYYNLLDYVNQHLRLIGKEL